MLRREKKRLNAWPVLNGACCAGSLPAGRCAWPWAGQARVSRRRLFGVVKLERHRLGHEEVRPGVHFESHVDQPAGRHVIDEFVGEMICQFGDVDILGPHPTRSTAAIVVSRSFIFYLLALICSRNRRRSSTTSFGCSCCTQCPALLTKLTDSNFVHAVFFMRSKLPGLW